MAGTRSLTGKNIVQIQLENRSALLKLLRQNNHVCRKELAEMTGLTGAAVTNLIRDLIAVDLVSEDREYNGPLNRNAVSLKINFENFFVIGVTLRRGELTCVVSDLSGKLIEKNSLLLELDETVDKTLSCLEKIVNRYMCNAHYKGRILGMGVSVPGPLNLEKGEINFLINMPSWSEIMPDWRETPIKKYLEERFGLPVILDKLANAAVLAEKWFGCGKKYNNIISILVSKGIGAGIITDGRIFHGAFGSAGDIGHVSIDYNGSQCGCGNKGCLELYCSILALLKKAQDIYGFNTISDLNVIRERVAKGDKKLSELVVESGQYLGYAIVNLAKTFNPELIVLHGDMSDFGMIWFNSVKQVVNERMLPETRVKPEISLSTLPESPILLGTVAMVCEYVFEHPYMEYFKK